MGELEPNPRIFSVSGSGCDRADLVDKPASKREGRDEQLAELLRSPKARDVVEKIRDVGGDLLVRREHAEILVEPRGRCVVVARADVSVATQRVALAAHYQCPLRADLQIGEPVRHVDTSLLEGSRPLDIAQLVEAGLE